MKKARKPTTAWKHNRDQAEGEAEERQRPGGKGKPRRDRDQAEGEAEERQRPGGRGSRGETETRRKGKPRRDRDQAEGEAEEKDSDSTGQRHGAKTTHGSDLIYSNLTPESRNIKLHWGKHPTTCHSQ